MAVLAGEGGLLVGYGGCGRPGLGLGCAESLSGVPRLYEPSRFFSGMITISVSQKSPILKHFWYLIMCFFKSFLLQ